MSLLHLIPQPTSDHIEATKVLLTAHALSVGIQDPEVFCHCKTLVSLRIPVDVRPRGDVFVDVDVYFSPDDGEFRKCVLSIPEVSFAKDEAIGAFLTAAIQGRRIHQMIMEFH